VLLVVLIAAAEASAEAEAQYGGYWGRRFRRSLKEERDRLLLDGERAQGEELQDVSAEIVKREAEAQRSGGRFGSSGGSRPYVPKCKWRDCRGYYGGRYRG